jgi:hypothetical protein
MNPGNIGFESCQSPLREHLITIRLTNSNLTPGKDERISDNLSLPEFETMLKLNYEMKE